MTIVIVTLAVAVILFGLGLGLMITRLSEAEKQIRRMAIKVAGNSDYVNRVDDSTGKAIRELNIKFHELEMRYETFQKLYGEAAVEKERETAKAEKAWADGISAIMSYGAGLHERGDAT